MAGGLGYKAWVNGVALSVSDILSYLQDQTVMVFASAAARTTALASVLAEGMISYRLDGHVVERYNGTSWDALMTLAANQVLTAPVEFVNLLAAAPAATQNIDAVTSGVWYFQNNAANNAILNFRASATATLDSLLAVGESISFTVRVTNGATPYYVTAITVDGAANTPHWVGGTAPSAGDASARDLYTFAIVKTAAATFDVTAQMAKA